LPRGWRHALANVVRFDRNFSMAPVDQDRQAYGARPAEVDQAVERRANGSARIQNVVAEHDASALELELDLGLLQKGLRCDRRKVVPIERDVERPDGKGLSDEIGEPGS